MRSGEYKCFFDVWRGSFSVKWYLRSSPVGQVNKKAEQVLARSIVTRQRVGEDLDVWWNRTLEHPNARAHTFLLHGIFLYHLLGSCGEDIDFRTLHHTDSWYSWVK